MKKSILFIGCSIFLAAAQLAVAEDHGTDTAITLAEVVVTAEKIIDYIQNHPQRVVTLERSEIEERNFLDLGEALNTMPGVEVRERGSGIGAAISIRGSGKGSGVLVLVNGRPLNSSQFGSVDLGNIPIDMVNRITVYKPPVPVWLGSGAAEGAINIETRSSDTEELLESNDKATLKVSGGSYGMAKVNYSYLTPRPDGSVMVTASASHRDGKRLNSDRDSGSLGLHWDKTSEEQAKYEVNGRFYVSKHGTPGPTYNLTPDARQRYTKGSFDFRMQRMVGEVGEYSVKGYADRTELEDRSQSGITSDLEVSKLGLKGERVWADVAGQWALRLGGRGEQDKVDHTLTGKHHRETFSANSQFDRDFGKMAASIGLRGDYTNDFDFFSAFTSGLSYEMGPKTLFKTNIGYTVNIPSFGQLYQHSHGSFDHTRGNPDLDEEAVWSYDLGVEYRFDKGRFLQATLFRSDYCDQIIYVRGSDLISRPENVSRSWRQGIEMSLKYQLTKAIDLDFSYIWQESEIRDFHSNLTYTPQHKGKVTVKTVLKSGTRLEATLRAVSHQYADPENSEGRKLNPYETVDLKVIHPFTLKKWLTEWYLNIYNLFDSAYESHQGYPDDGIRVMVGVKMNL